MIYTLGDAIEIYKICVKLHEHILANSVEMTFTEDLKRLTFKHSNTKGILSFSRTNTYIDNYATNDTCSNICLMALFKNKKTS